MLKSEKRAVVVNLWNATKLLNDERGYWWTCQEGIPDGDDMETVIVDMQDGFYDDELDNLIDLYTEANRKYNKYGYYVKGGRFDFDYDVALASYNVKKLRKITKGKVE